MQKTAIQINKAKQLCAERGLKHILSRYPERMGDEGGPLFSHREMLFCLGLSSKDRYYYDVIGVIRFKLRRFHGAVFDSVHGDGYRLVFGAQASESSEKEIKSAKRKLLISKEKLDTVTSRQFNDMTNEQRQRHTTRRLVCEVAMCVTGRPARKEMSAINEKFNLTGKDLVKKIFK